MKLSNEKLVLYLILFTIITWLILIFSLRVEYPLNGVMIIPVVLSLRTFQNMRYSKSSSFWKSYFSRRGFILYYVIYLSLMTYTSFVYKENPIFWELIFAIYLLIFFLVSRPRGVPHI